MASDDDVVYVDVIPRLDDSETEKATSKLRDKFKQGAQGAGKAISDVLHRSWPVNSVTRLRQRPAMREPNSPKSWDRRSMTTSQMHWLMSESTSTT